MEGERANVARHPVAGEPPAGAWRWSVVGLLFLATVLNYLDRQTLAICAPLVKEEFGLSEEEYGRLLSAFRWAYAAVLIPAGLLADRIGVRLLYPLAVAVWSLAGAAAAWVGGPAGLAWTRAALGAGEAFNWPCALRVTADILPPRDRGLGNGLFQSGTAVGPLLAPLVILPLALAGGWRSAFLFVGALGVLWVALWFSLTSGRRLSRPDEEAAHPRQEQAEGARGGSVFGRPGFWLLLVAAGAINPCLYFLADWLPSYLSRQRDLTLVWAGLATMPVFLGLDLGNVGAGGLLKGLMGRGRSPRRARAVGVALGALLALCAVPAPFVAGAALSVGLLGLAGMGIAAIMSCWLTSLQDVFRGRVGLGMGLLGAFGQVAGAAVNPLIGRYVDRTGHYDLIFLLLGLAPAVAALALWLCDRVEAGERGY